MNNNLMVEEMSDTAVETLRQLCAPVSGEDTIAEAGRKVLLADFVRMLENESGSRTGADVKAVHDMRVATRRMRSALRLLENVYKARAIRSFEQTLKQASAALGKVRDLDVLIESLSQYRADLSGEDQEALLPILEALNKRQAKAVRKLNGFLDGELYAQFVADFTEFARQPGRGVRAVEGTATPYQVRHVLPTLVHDRLANVRAYDNVIENGDVQTLHALRIEFKRLRYVVAFFQDVLGNSGTDYLEALKAIQDHLGALNDAVVVQARLNALLEDSDWEHITTEVVGSYISILAARQDSLQQSFADVWTRFNTRSVQRKLSDALLVLR